MVEIKGAEADRWIRNLPSDIAVYLVCGQDEGLVAERARAIVRGSVEDPADPFQVVVLEGNAVAAEPERLLDEVYTIGLFGGRRLVRVSVGSRPLAPIVANVLERPSPGCTLLLEGGSIKSDSPLRKLLAGARNAVVIDCWSDDAKQLDALIDEEFVAAGLTIEPAARTLLASLIGADRLATRSELAKLTLYAHGREVVTEADVETIVADASPSVFDEHVWLAYSGSEKVFDDATLGASPQEMVALPLFALRHGVLLHRLRVSMDAGAGVDQAVAQAYRMPQKRKALLRGQLQLWSTVRLSSVLEHVRGAVARTRLEPALAPLLAARTIWTIAAAARRQR